MKNILVSVTLVCWVLLQLLVVAVPTVQGAAPPIVAKGVEGDNSNDVNLSEVVHHSKHNQVTATVATISSTPEPTHGTNTGGSDNQENTNTETPSLDSNNPDLNNTDNAVVKTVPGRSLEIESVGPYIVFGMIALLAFLLPISAYFFSVRMAKLRKLREQRDAEAAADVAAKEVKFEEFAEEAKFAEREKKYAEFAERQSKYSEFAEYNQDAMMLP
ncbi:11072_t:CDS:2 [Ambispora gerdemannii]|uniref:11072_t:CDS:1 n=1 Tax=Ambispora gerdemannii TaxID=144530 RepID=A0A9N8UWR0_9GLOM|nr:11072_t:CDS:2 [Ambispora gerdemannii]